MSGMSSPMTLVTNLVHFELTGIAVVNNIDAVLTN